MATATNNLNDEDEDDDDNDDDHDINNNNKKKKHRVGTKANTTQWHLSFVLFGGPAEFVSRTGETKRIHFRDAFAEGLSYDHLKRAAAATGYLFPNDRGLLNSPKLRHELFEDAADESKTPHQIMIENIEQENKEAVDFLLSRGYDLADELLIPLEKISKEEQDDRKERQLNSVPNTQNFRERLIKIRRTAGAWWNVTNGGICLNCDDALIAIEAEKILERKASLEKKKTNNNRRKEQIKKAKKVLAAKGYNLKDWTDPMLKVMIRYHDPSIPVTSKKYNGRSDWEKLWEEAKKKTPPSPEDVAEWTEKDKDDYNNLISDGKKDINRLYIMRRAEQRKMDSYVKQLEAIQLNENKVKVLSSSLQTLDKEQRQEVLNNWEDHCIDDDYDLSETSSLSSIEEEKRQRRVRHEEHVALTNYDDDDDGDVLISNSRRTFVVNDDDEEEEEGEGEGEEEEEEEEEEDEEKDSNSDSSGREEIVLKPRESRADRAANRIAAAAAAAAGKTDDDEDTVDPQAIRNELAGGDRVVLPSSPPSTIVTHLSKEEEEDDEDDDTDDSLSLLPTRATRSKKKQAPKKPASKKKPAPKKPAETICCAGDFCQCGGIIIGSNGHPCVVCKERMHGGPCSNGMVEDPNGMTCKKCAASAENTGRRKTRAKPKQSPPPPPPLPLATQTNTRGSRRQQAKAAAVTKRPPITRTSKRNK